MPPTLGATGPRFLHRRARSQGSEHSTAPRIVHEVLSSPGRALDPATRAFMEPRFGHDFGRVRIHTDARAVESARSLDAHAYTVWQDVVFGAGRYAPATPEGRRLLAHELAHVVQQRGPSSRRAELLVLPAASAYEREADELAARVVAGGPGQVSGGTVSPPPTVGIQRQAAPACPGDVRFSSELPVHVPPCGPFRARTDVRGVAWSLLPDPTAVDPATRIAADGVITIGPAQSAGQLKARATGATGCFFEHSFTVRSHPTGIASTVVISQAGPPNFGGQFDHVFTSADGNVASLENVGVGERFIGIPTPAAAQHAITAPLNPFGGTFALSTATLTPTAIDNWFLTNAGMLGGNQDNVTIGRAAINVGRFVQSASNPNPPRGLPADMTIRQGLHWFCPQAPAANRWRMPAFVTVAHSRTLRNRGGVVEFVTTVNGVEVVQDYDGPKAVFNATATPVSTPRSAPAPAAPRTVQITVDTLPSALQAGQALRFAIVGPARGCAVAPDPANDHAAVLSVGREAGPVVVEVADATNTNRARVTVTIT